MSEEEKSHFYKEAEHLKNLHKIQHPDYKYAPKVSKQVIKNLNTFNKFLN